VLRLTKEGIDIQKQLSEETVRLAQIAQIQGQQILREAEQN